MYLIKSFLFLLCVSISTTNFLQQIISTTKLLNSNTTSFLAEVSRKKRIIQNRFNSLLDS